MQKYVKVATYPSICDEWYDSVTNGRSSESRTESIRVLPSRDGQRRSQWSIYFEYNVLLQPKGRSVALHSCIAAKRAMQAITHATGMKYDCPVIPAIR